MLSTTVYQGKSAGSWKTTARLGSGPFTGAPLTRTRPRVGVSKPATTLSKVDLPHPLGPRIAANSFSSTAKSMAWSASTLRPRLLNSFQTSLTEIACSARAAGGLVELVPGFASAMSLESPPAKHKPREADDDAIGDEAEESDREHRGHADVHPPDVVGV